MSHKMLVLLEEMLKLYGINYDSINTYIAYIRMKNEHDKEFFHSDIILGYDLINVKSISEDHKYFLLHCLDLETECFSDINYANGFNEF